MTDEAQAVADSAKVVGKIIDVVTGVVSYLAEVVGDIPKNLVGVWGGDKLRERRIRNITLLEAETRAFLTSTDEARLSFPSPSVMIPLLTAAADEERETLRTMWAKLMANTVIDGGTKVRREFFETMRRLEPADAMILDVISDATVFLDGDSHAWMATAVTERFGVQPFERIVVDVSMGALIDLKCAVNLNYWGLTSYGQAFVAACKVD